MVCLQIDGTKTAGLLIFWQQVGAPQPHRCKLFTRQFMQRAVKTAASCRTFLSSGTNRNVSKGYQDFVNSSCPYIGCFDAQYCTNVKTCTLRTRLVLQSCDSPAGAKNLHFAYYTCTSKLRSSSQSWKLVLHVLYLLAGCDLPASAGDRARLVLHSCNSPAWYYKVAIFQLELETCTSRARLVLQSRNLQLEL